MVDFEVIHTVDLPDSAKLIYTYAEANDPVRPQTIAALAERHHFCPDTVRKALRRLEEHGYATRVNPGATGRGNKAKWVFHSPWPDDTSTAEEIVEDEHARQILFVDFGKVAMVVDAFAQHTAQGMAMVWENVGNLNFQEILEIYRATDSSGFGAFLRDAAIIEAVTRDVVVPSSRNHPQMIERWVNEAANELRYQLEAIAALAASQN